MDEQPRPHRFTVVEYHRMAEVGLLAPDARVELIEGEIIDIPIGEEPRRHRFTVEEYYRMAEVGLLAPDARVELIEGEIIDMPPIGSRHAETVMRLTERLGPAVGARGRVSCQSPIHLDDLSEPQPDVAVLASRDYGEWLPSAADTLLVIEVSETTLRDDRSTKLSLYAEHGVPEVWIVDTAGSRLHTFRNPSGAAYSEAITTDVLGLVSVMAFPDVRVDLSGLLR